MPIDLFGFSIGRKSLKTEEDKRSELKSFVRPEQEDGSTIIDSGAGYFGTYVDFNQEVKSEIEFINRYREMALHPEVEGAVEDIVNESIVYDREKKSIELSLDKTDLSDNIKDKIHEEFDYLYHLLKFSDKGFEIFRRWFIDGKLYYHMVVDSKSPKKGILDIRYVEPTLIKKVVELEKGIENNKSKGAQEQIEVIKKTEEYFIYKEKPEQSTGIRIATEAVCYVTSGLYDASNRKVISYLHKAIKPLNQLRMIEDAVVIYRISRAPERRIFYIDVGKLPKTKAEQYVRSIMNKYRNKLVYDASTGAIRDDKRHMNMLEDFWLPRQEGGRGTEIQTLDGGQNLGEMDDVLYFQKKLYQALNVPRTRLESGEQFSMGRASEITRDEVKFMKYIDRLRNKFCDVFKIMLKTQCLLKGIITDQDWEEMGGDVGFDFVKDNHFSELKDYEIISERMNILRDVNDYIGKYYSVGWVRKNILQQSDEEMKDLDKEIAKEREAGIITDDGNEGY
tara:strand:- start:1176 stop:2696 length:1521 start_codon:yes stop_codon:yes gene_type:complete